MITLSAKVEARELDRYLKRLDKNRDRPLHRRAEWTLKAAAQRELVPRIKVAAKGSHKRWRGGRSKGQLARKVKAKFLSKRSGEVIRPTWVGSSAFYAHMVIGGTKAHALGSRGAPWVAFGLNEVRRASDVTHPGARSKPFIDQGAAGIWPDRIVAMVKRDVFDVR